MNGAETGALPLNMVTASEPSPTRRMGARALAALAALAAACFPNPPGVRGVAGTAPTPSVFWTPPRERGARDTTHPAAALPPELAQRVQGLQFTDVIDIPLRNNSATTAAWADARAAAASYGAAQGQYYPTISLDGAVTAIKTVPSAGRSAVQQQFYGPTLNLSWLLVDLGGRSGSIGEAREALLAADWSHNAVIQNVVLGVESAYFGYMATKALLVAQQTTLKEAQTNLGAAEERHRLGLATIADVLQAKTALSRAQLTLETTQGALQTTRGALALSMGLPANVPYDVAIPPDTLPPLGITDSVDTLIERAVRERPDLAAARAEARGIHARVSVARSGQVAPARYKAGAGSLLDLWTAQAALADARAQAIQSRFSWFTALAQLAHDTGILGLDGSSPLHVQRDSTGMNR